VSWAIILFMHIWLGRFQGDMYELLECSPGWR
jgi:hypothetical protein